MSRNDIRLRRQRLAGGGSHRFRNYGAVLERHERDVKIKKIVRVFTYFAIILIVVMLLIIVTRTGERLEKAPGDEKTSLIEKSINFRQCLEAIPQHSIPYQRHRERSDAICFMAVKSVGY